MHIVYCIPAISASGGMERVVISKANYFVDHGYEVSVITTDQTETKNFFSLDSRVQHYDLGIKYYKNSHRALLSKVYYYLVNRRQHKSKLTKLLNKLRADVVVSVFMNEMSILPYINDGSKKVLEFHFSRPIFNIKRRKGLKGLLDKMQERLDVRHIRSYDSFVVLTEEDRRNWSELSNVSVIHNASTYSNVSANSKRDLDAIAVGRYTSQKGFANLLEVWWHLKGEYKLYIYGEGELHDNLEHKIRELNLTDRVYLMGASKDIRTVFERASLLVMTSLYEGLPMVMIEAQTCGVPIVTYDFPCGPKDVITNGYDGYIIPWGEQELMANKISEVLDDVNLWQEMSLRAKESAKKFSPDTIMTQWCELFEEIISK